jgi:copper homeostasis protein
LHVLDSHELDKQNSNVAFLKHPNYFDIRAMILEVVAESIGSCLNAQKAGAWRVELCSALEVGGLTPGSGLIQIASHYITIPIHVLIRPRPGNFTYSHPEMAVIEREIQNCKVMGVAGVVIGMLDDDREVDTVALKRLVERARPMEVTFHRAIDVSNDVMRSLEHIIDAGCDRVLTSGGKLNSVDGLDVLGKMVKNYGQDIEIMVGKGVNAQNIPLFASVGVTSFHVSGSVRQESAYSSELFDMGYNETDLEAIKEAKRVIKALRSGNSPE